MVRFALLIGLCVLVLTAVAYGADTQPPDPPFVNNVQDAGNVPVYDDQGTVGYVHGDELFAPPGAPAPRVYSYSTGQQVGSLTAEGP